MESAESGPLPPAPDLCGVDVYAVPDPGLLTEKNGEGARPPPPQAHLAAGLPQAQLLSSGSSPGRSLT